MSTYTRTRMKTLAIDCNEVESLFAYITRPNLEKIGGRDAFHQLYKNTFDGFPTDCHLFGYWYAVELPKESTQEKIKQFDDVVTEALPDRKSQ